ncbi:Spore cortex-lytic enzyme precursor [Pelotomaculum schinkii]|uniref:Spore cortex-lytic enzyme n=1 Tax=Pelotomaculum schinkii TaxID=78350 RepID=A0A4Y7R8Q2_9FIRM|nr:MULTISPECIES: cell wall hydrolase [Pelotomaculum]TEB05063.1 Spore cortex-lytic enzyme precursor [Pelotomaculum schinkii]TEB14337.1 Spore cortex-lytic enzyme precursor [Pelotomaculum sp. FP]
MNIKKIAVYFAVGLSVLSLKPAVPSEAIEPAPAKPFVSVSRGLCLSREEFYLLARLIHAEARGEPLEGQVAVGAVVFNRLKDPRFPKTITGVIYEDYQFTPVLDGTIELTPDAQAFLAAELALNGLDPANGSIFFYNPDQSESRWLDGLPSSLKIGKHIFC